VFQEQMKPAGGSAAQDDLIHLLTVLDEYGGRLSSAGLSRATRYPLNQLRETLATAERVLNVDGFPVLTRDEASDSVVLNRDLLWRQFDLSLWLPGQLDP
jgi:hypothetical protein